MTNVMPVGAPAIPAQGRVEVWSYDATSGKDYLARVTGGKESADLVARTAFANATRVDTYYRTVFHRNGWDGKGAATKVRVHAPDDDGTTPMNNAKWYHDEGRIWLGDGDGSLFAPLGNAADVVAHEFTHGVIDSEVDLTYALQEGALHESFSDVLATGIDGNLLVGEDVFTPGRPGDSLRDLANPTYGDARTLPAWVDEVHDLSGIPSLAAVKTAGKIGADRMRSIWYEALTNHLKSHSGFAGAAQATLAAAQRLYGEASGEYAAVRDAWAAVGVTAATPKVRDRVGPVINALQGTALALAPLR